MVSLATVEHLLMRQTIHCHRHVDQHDDVIAYATDDKTKESESLS